MNKLVIKNNTLESIIDDAIIIKPFYNNPLTNVDTLQIDFLKDTYLELDCNFSDSVKLNIIFNVHDNVDVMINEIKKGSFSKIENDYYLENNSTVSLNRFYNVDGIKEMNIINLNGKNAKVDYVLKTISRDKEKYDVIVNHNSSNTISSINSSGVSISKGSITFNVTSVVPFGKKGCIVDQDSRIINLNDMNSTINPNLLIEDNDIVANHAAFIGKFSDSELFYLMSRGISYESAINLLIRGFLKSNLNFNDDMLIEIDQMIDLIGGTYE